MTTLRWGERTYVMGVINLTPDSFSGDGLATPERDAAAITAAAVDQATTFVEAGVDILDIGAESSRPPEFYGEHPPISADAEARLAAPVVAALANGIARETLISIDTVKGEVARAALAWSTTCGPAAGIRAPWPPLQPATPGWS